MATDVRIDGKPYWDATNFSFSEEATPIEPSDRAGAVGQFSFDLTERSESKLWMGKTADLESGTQGITTGKVAGLTGGKGTVTVTANSRMIALNVKRVAQPFIGTLEGALRYYCGLVGINTGVIVDATIGAIPVTLLGWDDVVWERLKALTGALLFEISLVSDNIVARPVRTRIGQTYRNSDIGWSIDDSQIAQSIVVNYYQSSRVDNALVYPAGGWNPDAEVMDIGAGEVKVYNLPLSASITSLSQPVQQLTVAQAYVASSVYSVSGYDGLPIEPAEWQRGGGSVTVAIGDDTRSIDVTVTGSIEAQYAPFKIAVDDSESSPFSSLRIIGTGVSYDMQSVTIFTGRDVDKAPTVIGATVDSEAILTIGDAWKAGGRAAAQWKGGRQTITLTTTSINRVGESGSLRRLTIGEFKAQNPGITIGFFKTLNPGQTIGEFNDAADDSVRSNFANQGFGNYSGARIFEDFAWYRITAAQPTPTGASVTAVADTTIGDFKQAFPGMTIGQFKAMRARRTIGEFSARPLIAS